MPDTRFKRFRERLSFANVTSALALFIALGGTSYAAVTLPANSVGRDQIRTGGVGKSEVGANTIGRSEIRAGGVGRSEIATGGVAQKELRNNSVGPGEIRNGRIAPEDLSDAAKSDVAALKGVTFRVAATEAGAAAGGNAKSVSPTGPGVYSVDFGQDVSACQVSATIAGAGAAPGVVTVAPGASTNLLTVSTFEIDAAGMPAAPVPANKPFQLLVAC
jgi:DNA-binding transcriptional regulator YdaS (Cro superfamily)